MIIWDSESEVAFYDVTEDVDYISLDEENGVFRINDYEMNGSHLTTMGFLGPAAEENAKRWDEFVSAKEAEEEGVNTDTEELIRTCFGLGDGN